MFVTLKKQVRKGRKSKEFQIIELFDGVDNMMYEFIELRKNPGPKEIYYEINGVRNRGSLLKLFH